MWWLTLKVVVFEAIIVFFSTVMMLFTTWRYEVIDIDAAYQREVIAMRMVSIREQIDERLPVERRAAAVSDAIIEFLDQIRLPTSSSRYITGLLHGSEHLDPGEWWHTIAKPRMARFLPTLYMRVETYSVVYWFSLPLLILAYFWGEYFARRKILEARSKKNQVVAFFKWCLRGLNVVLASCAGLVVFPPVAYWIVPSLLLAGTIAMLVRANHVELKA